MRIAEFLAIDWSAPSDPLIQPPRFSPVIADPTFLFPEETPDGTWALFAHSAWGLHRYESADGTVWADRGLVIRNAMRPFVRRVGEEYLLLYEAYAPFGLALTALPGRRRWKSAIAAARSADLRRWKVIPAPVLAPTLPWMRDEKLGDAVSNPCLVRTEEGSLLYFSASLVWLDDCGFCEPRSIGRARGGPPETTPMAFVPESEPVIDPASEALPRADVERAVGAGSLKVLAFEDGYVGLQNKIYRDGSGRSRSAIFLLVSEDGARWRDGREAPLVAPASGWTASHVYACDCRYREANGTWYLYFNARDGWRIRDGVERIGRIVGRPAAGGRRERDNR